MALPYDNILKADIRYGSSSSQTKLRPTLSGNFKRGEWYHVVMRVRFSPVAGKAICQVWLNGANVINDTSTPMGYSDSTRNYWKFGIYRRRTPETQAAQFANMEVVDEASGKTLQDRILNPLPIVGK